MQHRHTVLFVDDEVNILRALQRLLRSEDMNVLCSSRGEEALETLSRQPVQVVVSDQRMPEMSGVDLLSRVRERWPDVVRMMLTGYTEMTIAVDAMGGDAAHVERAHTVGVAERRGLALGAALGHFAGSLGQVRDQRHAEAPAQRGGLAVDRVGASVGRVRRDRRHDPIVAVPLLHEAARALQPLVIRGRVGRRQPHNRLAADRAHPEG